MAQIESNENKPELKKEAVKSISKQLISEIHLCRYLFKLLGRIKESSQKGILRNFKYEVETLERKYTMFIKHKVDKLISFEHLNFLNIDESSYREYKETSDFKKILKISKEYKDRYRVELADNWSSYFDKKFTLD